MDQDNNKKLITSLRKASSHIDRIIEMIENDRECKDVIQQLNAVHGYINSTREKLIANHLRVCVTKTLKYKSKKVQERYISEIVRVINILS